MKPGEDVEQEASEKFVRRECHGLHAIPLPPVPAGEADLAVSYIFAARVFGERGAVCGCVSVRSSPEPSQGAADTEMGQGIEERATKNPARRPDWGQKVGIGVDPVSSGLGPEVLYR